MAADGRLAVVQLVALVRVDEVGRLCILKLEGHGTWHVGGVCWGHFLDEAAVLGVAVEIETMLLVGRF